MMISRLIQCVGLLCVVGITPTASAASLPEKVSAARAEVDALAERLESQRRTTRNELAALRARVGQLEHEADQGKAASQILSQMIASGVAA